MNSTRHDMNRHADFSSSHQERIARVIDLSRVAIH